MTLYWSKPSSLHRLLALPRARLAAALLGESCEGTVTRRQSAASLFSDDSRERRSSAGPKVSVYVPAYNAARWLRRAIDSALAQTMSDLEVCICDDGSTDATADILEREYGSEPRVRWSRQEHRGVATASNEAVRLCRGKYILQLDADDELLPECAARLARALDCDAELSLVYAGHERVDGRGRILRLFLPVPYDPYHHLIGNCATHPRMFRARDFARTEGFDESLSSAVDYDISLKLAERGRVVSIPRILYRYHVHGDNLSVRDLMAQRQNHRVAVERALRRRGLDWHIVWPNLEDHRAIEEIPPGLPRWKRSLLGFLYARGAAGRVWGRATSS